MRGKSFWNSDSCGSDLIMERLEKRIVLDDEFHYYDDGHFLRGFRYRGLVVLRLFYRDSQK